MAFLRWHLVCAQPGSAPIIIALIYNYQISTLTGGGCLRLMVLNKHTNCEQYNWGNLAAVLC